MIKPLKHLIPLILGVATLTAFADAPITAEEAYARAQALIDGNGVVRDTKAATVWLEQAHTLGDKRAAIDLGKIYSSGRGVAADLLAAARWFELSPMPEAAFELAKLQAAGRGVEKDAEQAFANFLIAAKCGIPDAFREVAERYERGHGVAVDKEQAVRWYRSAAESYDGAAQHRYAELLDRGEGCPVDAREAVRWLREAAMQDIHAAQHALGVHYLEGRGVPRDEVQALMWFNIAASRGQAVSREARDDLETKLGQAATLKAQDLGRELYHDILIGTIAAREDPAPVYLQPADADAPKSQGSGAIISVGGLVLTAHHVVNGAKHVVVLLDGKPHAAKLVCEDPSNDLALLRITAPGLHPLPLASRTALPLGTMVATVGFPNPSVQGNAIKATRGDISGIVGAYNEVRDWQVSVPIQSGNSGGPLLNERGQLVGVVVSKLNGPVGEDMPQNVSYARKGAYVRAFLEPYLSELVEAGEDSAPAPEYPAMIDVARQSVVWVRVY